MNSRDQKVLKLWLKYGHSRRSIEYILKMTSRNGKSAQDIIDRYGIRDPSLRGRLLGCHDDQFKMVASRIQELSQGKAARSAWRAVDVDALVPQDRLGLIEPYRRCVILAGSAEAFHEAVKDVVTNVTQQVFDPCKRLAGACQRIGCGRPKASTQLDTAHIGKSRPALFIEAAKEAASEGLVRGMYAFDFYESIRLYLRKHLDFPNRVRFLCKTCHRRLENLQRPSDHKSRTARRESQVALRALKATIR